MFKQYNTVYETCEEEKEEVQRSQQIEYIDKNEDNDRVKCIKEQMIKKFFYNRNPQNKTIQEEERKQDMKLSEMDAEELKQMLTAKSLSKLENVDKEETTPLQKRMARTEEKEEKKPQPPHKPERVIKKNTNNFNTLLEEYFETNVNQLKEKISGLLSDQTIRRKIGECEQLIVNGMVHTDMIFLFEQIVNLFMNSKKVTFIPCTYTSSEIILSKLTEKQFAVYLYYYNNHYFVYCIDNNRKCIHIINSITSHNPKTSPVKSFEEYSVITEEITQQTDTDCGFHSIYYSYWLLKRLRKKKTISKGTLKFQLNVFNNISDMILKICLLMRNMALNITDTDFTMASHSDILSI